MINLFSYAGLPPEKLLKIKLKNEPAYIYGTLKKLGPLQKENESDGITVANDATLQLIEDIDTYIKNPAAYTGYSDLELLTTHIETIDVIEL